MIMFNLVGIVLVAFSTYEGWRYNHFNSLNRYKCSVVETTQMVKGKKVRWAPSRSEFDDNVGHHVEMKLTSKEADLRRIIFFGGLGMLAFLMEFIITNFL